MNSKDSDLFKREFEKISSSSTMNMCPPCNNTSEENVSEKLPALITKEDEATHRANKRLSYAEQLIKNKHHEYHNQAKFYSLFYYCTRLIIGCSAGTLPFIIAKYPEIATYLSLVIVITTVFDLIFNPKDKLELFSKATDILAIAELKIRGEYDEYKDILEAIRQIESGKVEKLINIDELIKKIENSNKIQTIS